MALITRSNGITSVILRVKISDISKSDGSGLTGLTYNSLGLKISVIADVSATPTVYMRLLSIESIATLGTFSEPTPTYCRFREVDANHPGLYEIQLSDATWAVSGAKSAVITIYGCANMAQTDALIDLGDINPQILSDTGSIKTSVQPLATMSSTLSSQNTRIGGIETNLTTNLNAKVGDVKSDTAAIISGVNQVISDTGGIKNYLPFIKDETDKISDVITNLDTANSEIDDIKTTTDQIQFDENSAVIATSTNVSGNGLIAYDYIVWTDSSKTIPLPDCAVVCSSDAAGKLVIGKQYSNAQGITTWHLSPGNYYFWRYKFGLEFNNPDCEAVNE